VLFAAFGAVFQFFVFGNLWNTWIGQWLLPLALIAAGVALLFARQQRSA
jgi:hypothetical protein